MFKVGERVEWCYAGRFDLYGKSVECSEHDFGVVKIIDDGSRYVWCEWEYSEDLAAVRVEELRKAPQKEPPVRWFVETRKLGHEFFGESWETVVESKPVLQVKFEGHWIDVPVFKSEVFDVN